MAKSEIWFDVSTPKSARRAMRVGMLGCIWIIGGSLVSGLLTDWKVLDLGVSGDWAIIAGLLYGVLGWAIYRASKTLTLGLVILHVVGDAAAVIVDLMKGQLHLGWADCITTAMLIQGARGVVHYRRMKTVPAIPTETGDSHDHPEVPPGSMTGSTIAIENGSVRQDESVPAHVARIFKFCPDCGRSRESDCMFCAKCGHDFHSDTLESSAGASAD